MLPLSRGFVSHIKDDTVFCTVNLVPAGFGMVEVDFPLKDLKWNPDLDETSEDPLDLLFFGNDPLARLTGRLIEFHFEVDGDGELRLLNQSFRILPILDSSFCNDCKKRIAYLLQDLQVGTESENK